ncbi:MAG: hypothetical protein R3C61_01755 [Bacteroidia bacterium]
MIPVFHFSTQAQVADFRAEMEYLHGQKDRYQRWLDHSGIGKILHVHDLAVEEKDVILYLAFSRPGDTEYIVNAWETLKSSFEQEHSLSLEQTLFYKWITLSDISPEANVGVYVYDTYTPGEPKLFGREIYFDSDSARVITEEYNPKSIVRKINITPPSFTDKKVSETQIRKQMTKELVYEKIYNYASQQFKQQTCEQRFPEVKREYDKDVLRFKVIDLCRVVFENESQHSLCEIFRSLNLSDCNWMKREVLFFTITHEETYSGVRITVEIEGKYGSGFYGSSYNNLNKGFIDMENEFSGLLKDFADSFAMQLEKLLVE